MDDVIRALVERLERRIAELEEENRQLRERVQQLEGAAARQAAPFRRPPNKKVPEDQKKRPGRPPGHAGACRSMPSHVDEIVEVELRQCPQCQGPVTDRQRLEQYIEEIPPLRPQVTRLTTYCGTCARCGEVRSTHPLQTSTAGGAARVHLGPRALAWAASLNKEHGLTMRKTCAVLKHLLGLRLTPGGLAQALQRVAGKLAGPYRELIGTLRQRAAVFADETSWWVGGPQWWLWVFTTPDTTVYRVDESRGSQVVRDTLGDDFAGILVSDCLKTYDPLPYRKHKCIAHHLRAIAQARDRPDTSDPKYLKQCQLFFVAVNAIAKCRAAMRAEEYDERCRHLQAWCDRLLATEVSQPGDVSVRNRLAKQREHLLGCLNEPAAEPTNNRAERALRPAVIARKVSCGNKTIAGKHCWEILTSLAVTCRQRLQDVVDSWAARLPLAFAAG
jgi:hypothetical protein